MGGRDNTEHVLFKLHNRKNCSLEEHCLQVGGNAPCVVVETASTLQAASLRATDPQDTRSGDF